MSKIYENVLSIVAIRMIIAKNPAFIRDYLAVMVDQLKEEYNWDASLSTIATWWVLRNEPCCVPNDDFYEAVDENVPEIRDILNPDAPLRTDWNAELVEFMMYDVPVFVAWNARVNANDVRLDEAEILEFEALEDMRYSQA